jgi:VanZ family protein
MLVYLLLVNGKTTALRPIYLLFGGDNARTVDAIGHFIVIFIETNLSFSLLRHYLSPKTAVGLSIFIVLCAGIGAEIAQTLIAGRTADWLDILANALAVLLFLLTFHFLNKSQTSQLEAA